MLYERTPIATVTPRQRQSGYIRTQLLDELGEIVLAASLTEMTLRYYDLSSGQILQSRGPAQDVLGPGKTGLNGVSFPLLSAAGVVDPAGTEWFWWDWTGADMALRDLSTEVEVHIATFSRKWGTGKEDSFDVRFEVGRVHRLANA